MRGATLRATPREQMELREARCEQARVVKRALPTVSEGSVRFMAQAGWRRRIRHCGRGGEVALGDEVWLATHLRLWRVARLARGWLHGFRGRREARARREFGAELALWEAGLDEGKMGGKRYGEGCDAGMERCWE